MDIDVLTQVLAAWHTHGLIGMTIYRTKFPLG